MLRTSTLLAGLCCVVPAIAAPSSMDAFFRPGPGVDQALPADGLYPSGRRMLFSLYSIRSVHDDWARPGWTAIGPYYGEQSGGQFAPYDSPMDAAAALGVKALYRVGMSIPFLKEHETPPNEAIVEAIQAQVRPVLDRPEIAIWYVTPEELRHWRQDEMRYLQTAADAIRAIDPLQRPVMLYEPNNRGAKALAQTLPFLDISFRGLYANGTGHAHQRSWVAWGARQMVEAIAEVKPKAPAYAALWMAGDPDDPDDVARISRWARHDVYASLLNGATGIVIWSGFRRKGFTTFDQYLDGYAACASELNVEPGLADAFLFGERRDDVTATVVRGPATQAVANGKSLMQLPTLSFLNVALGDARYLMMLNSGEESISVGLSGLPSGEFRSQELPVGSARPSDASRWATVSVAPLQVRIWKLTR